ncbi:MAG TPA: MBL fold metallo-hydrolase [Allosphingosinicella sp.]|nr:MBL fold metallo-hydrolase [Allosphingosinicella sp.]
MYRAIAASLLFVGAPAVAQRPPPAPDIRIERIAPGVAVLFGRGGNIGVSYGADGNILIDDQYAPATERVVAAVRTLDPDPIRYVINTHWHGDHSGGNENLGRSGTVVVAHDNVRQRMSMEQVVRGERVPPSPGGALPVITFSENLTFHLNDDDVRAIHVEHAHTDGDVLIYWTRANVLHMGDTYFNGMLPFIDLDSGGSIDGAIVAVEAGLALANEGTAIIPGHGPMARRADLVRYRDMLVDLRSRVGQGIAAGRTLEQIKAERLADGYGPPDGFISPDALIETIYRSLRAAPYAEPHRH